MNKLDRNRRNFLWEGHSYKKEKKVNLIGWNVVVKPKVEGGLGSLQLKRKALAAK